MREPPSTHTGRNTALTKRKQAELASLDSVNVLECHACKLTWGQPWVCKRWYQGESSERYRWGARACGRRGPVAAGLGSSRSSLGFACTLGTARSSGATCRTCTAERNVDGVSELYRCNRRSDIRNNSLCDARTWQLQSVLSPDWLMLRHFMCFCQRGVGGTFKYWRTCCASCSAAGLPGASPPNCRRSSNWCRVSCMAWEIVMT